MGREQQLHRKEVLELKTLRRRLGDNFSAQLSDVPSSTNYTEEIGGRHTRGRLEATPLGASLQWVGGEGRDGDLNDADRMASVQYAPEDLVGRIIEIGFQPDGGLQRFLELCCHTCPSTIRLSTIASVCALCCVPHKQSRSSLCWQGCTIQTSSTSRGRLCL